MALGSNAPAPLVQDVVLQARGGVVRGCTSERQFLEREGGVGSSPNLVRPHSVTQRPEAGGGHARDIGTAPRKF